MIKLFDTKANVVREFTPITPGKVGIYACGPTVYDYAHLGNLRTYIFEDVLRRTLSMAGYEIRHVMNITDVGHLTSDADTGDDKVSLKAKAEKKDVWEIAEFYTKAFKRDIFRLNILEPTVWCKATSHIKEQIEAIQIIEKKGFTYRTKDGIYFDTSKHKGYGDFARLDTAGLNKGFRVEHGEKRNKTDFALWKFSPSNSQRQMEWDSPWGLGFPGWHIECSAMANKYLGSLFDIHLGGKDHIPVHHTNEVAQAKVCYGTTLSNYWLHGYFLETDGTKMSKSLGGFLTLQTLIDSGYDPLCYRYLCLTAHYRSDLTFSTASLDGASQALSKLKKKWLILQPHTKGEILENSYMGSFRDAIFSDLNTSKALAIMWAMLKSKSFPNDKKATLMAMDCVLGLGFENHKRGDDDVNISFFGLNPSDFSRELCEKIERLIEARNNARKKKDWAKADLLRQEIKSHGFLVEDSNDGQVIRKSSN